MKRFVLENISKLILVDLFSYRGSDILLFWTLINLVEANQHEDFEHEINLHFLSVSLCLCLSVCLSLSLSLYIYISKVKSATVVKCNSKISFYEILHRGVWESTIHFPRFLHFTLDPHLIILRKHQVPFFESLV